jgi:hypothetical protein
VIRIFNGVSMAIRYTLIVLLGIATLILCSLTLWLADERSIQQMKERHNHD